MIQNDVYSNPSIICQFLDGLSSHLYFRNREKVRQAGLFIRCRKSGLSGMLSLMRQKRQEKVAVAMSGGVDSSVAAALLKERGYEVIGLTMDVFDIPSEHSREKRLNSCGHGAKEDAIRVAAQLGISHSVIDLKKGFQKKVIAYFCEEYRTGRTPNPCIRCNRFIKFEALWRRAKNLGADFLATGHHARITQDKKSGRYFLLKGKDAEKDQSYFLYALTQEQLGRSLLPIGGFTKREVQKIARRFGLAGQHRAESQEICFIPDNDYVRFLKHMIPESFRPGPIVDVEDRVLGRHKGVLHFTIGQRRGMSVAAPHPLYVLEIQPEENRIVVGDRDQLFKRSVCLSQVNLIGIDKLVSHVQVKAKIRYKHPEAKAVLIPLEKKQVRLDFEKPQRAVAPGQSAVFYDGEVVIGGGVIETAED
jgi:tRNA-specific 2-thiouridylase